jgi:hypothetical protein
VDTARRLVGAALFGPAVLSGPSTLFGPAALAGPAALSGPALWNHEGQSRERRTPVVDADLIRRLAVGQAAYIYRGGVTFVQVKRLVAAPAELPRRARQADGAGRAAEEDRAGAPALGGPGRWHGAAAPQPGPLPDAGSLLDEAFGKEASP